MRRKRVPERVGRHVLRDPRPANRALNGSLNECVIDVVPTLFASLPVYPPTPLREYELPCVSLFRIWVAD